VEIFRGKMQKNASIKQKTHWVIQKCQQVTKSIKPFECTKQRWNENHYFRQLWHVLDLFMVFVARYSFIYTVFRAFELISHWNVNPQALQKFETACSSLHFAWSHLCACVIQWHMANFRMKYGRQRVRKWGELQKLLFYLFSWVFGRYQKGN